MAKFLVREGYNRKLLRDRGREQDFRFHVRHINYKDENGSFAPIDTTLSFDNLAKEWKQSKASYHCKIPEYADGWFEFFNAYEGANHTIKARPVASHVRGVYTHDEDGSDFVLYPDAFGKGIDLKVYSYWAGLKKVIIINEKPADTSKPLTFDFELDLPKDEFGMERVTQPGIVDQFWNKAVALDFSGKTLKIGEEGKESYFRNAMVWDSGDLRESVNIELYVKDGKTYLRKTITPDILDKAVYPLTTDHPTSYYAGAGDGYAIYNGAETWAEAHDAASAASAGYTSSSQIYSAYADNAGVWNIRIGRGFLPIDTSGIDDGASISAASVFLHFYAKGDGDNDANAVINIVQAFQASNTELVIQDYEDCGSDNGTAARAKYTPIQTGATEVDITGISTTGGVYTEFVLNATGIGWIVKDSYTKFGVREGHDIANDAPAATKSSFAAWRPSEDTSGIDDPYLDVTVEAGGEEEAEYAALSLLLSIPAIAAAYVYLTSAAYSAVALNISIPSITASYVQAEVAAFTPVALSLSVPALSASYAQQVTAAFSALAITLETPAMTATYSEVDSATFTPLALTLAVPAMTAVSGEVYQAAFDPALLSLAIPSISAVYVQSETSTFTPVSLSVAAPSMTAEHAEVHSAAFASIAISLAVPAITAGYVQEETAAFIALALTISQPAMTATRAEVYASAFAPASLVVEAPAQVPSYVDEQTAAFTPLSLLISSPAMTATVAGEFVAAFDSVSLTISQPSISASYVQAESAAFTAASLVLAQPNITAAYIEDEVAEFNALAMQFATPAMLAIFEEMDEAAFSPLSLELTVPPITAFEGSLAIASFVSLSLMISIPVMQIVLYRKNVFASSKISKELSAASQISRGISASSKISKVLSVTSELKED